MGHTLLSLEPHIVRACEKELAAGLSELKKHGNTKKHQANATSVKKTKSILQMTTTDPSIPATLGTEILA